MEVIRNLFIYMMTAVTWCSLFEWMPVSSETGSDLFTSQIMLPELGDHVDHGTHRKGHMGPFGESGPSLEIEVKTEFPEPAEFLADFVEQSKPLKLSGVARESRAVRQWTDNYLLSLEVPENSFVQLETKKKENRSQATREMHFQDFLKIYNETEYYMVDDVPSYLRPDVMVPCSLQCPELMEQGFAYALMWFSSGGTKSVVHSDAYDNINCLIRGEKTFVMVDPARHRDKIPLNRNGGYSDIDVDRVDLTLYPQLAEMEFYHVNITAGDCLYIPYRWIHQVRSYNSNVAVNFWWDHYASLKLLHQGEKQSICQGHCNTSLTLDQVELHGDNVIMEDYHGARDWLRDVVVEQPLTAQSIQDMFKEDIESEELAAEAEPIISRLFQALDWDEDGKFTTDDHAQITEEAWTKLNSYIIALTEMLKNADASEEGAGAGESAYHRDEL